MSISRYSQYSFSQVLTDEDGNRFLSLPDPFRYQDLPDNRPYVVQEGDTLESVAGAAYPDFPVLLDWLIGEFQPDPIPDCTLRLETGRLLILPSLRTVIADVFSDARRQQEADL